jgi:hypothetical protein
MAKKNLGALSSRVDPIWFEFDAVTRSCRAMSNFARGMVGRLTVVPSSMQALPANDVERATPRRKKKWSNTLRSADLAALLAGDK